VIRVAETAEDDGLRQGRPDLRAGGRPGCPARAGPAHGLLDEPARELRLLVDHRKDLIAERTQHINRLRWHLHDIDPAWAPKDRALTTMKHLRQTQDRPAELDTVVARIAQDLVERIRALTIDINALEAELDERTTSVAPHPRQVHGVAAVSSAKFIGEVAGIARFRSRHAFARHNRTAPDTRLVRQHRAAPAQPSGQPTTQRKRFTESPSPGSFLADARSYLDRRQEAGATRKEAIRSLKRRISDTIYRAMLADAQAHRAMSSTPLDIGETGRHPIRICPEPPTPKRRSVR
jgi:transposase